MRQWGGVQPAMEAVQRHMSRAMEAERLRLSRGLRSLATVAATAPFLGFVACFVIMMGSFKASAGERSAILAGMVHNLSQAMVPIVLSFGVAIPTFLAHRYFSGRVQTMCTEMSLISAELLNELFRPGRN